MAPVPYPKETGKRYKWDESIVNWVEEELPPTTT
jgi:hypothetical protein